MFKIIFLLSLIVSLAWGQTYIKGPALIEGLILRSTAGGTTTLTNTDQTNQNYIGVLNETLRLPDATTLPVGRYFQVQNRSTGIITVENGFGAGIGDVYPGTQKQFLLLNNGSVAGNWDVSGFDVTDVVGILPLINGGTNKALTASAGAIVYSDSDSFELDGAHFNWNATSQQLLINADGSTYTAAPANTILHTVGNNGATSRIVFDSHNSGVNGSYFLGRHARGTAAAPSAVINGDTLMGFAGVGYGATGYASNGSGYLLIRASETFSDTSNATQMQFFTTPTASITPLQRMNISSDGHVAIGTSAPVASGKLDIQGTDGALVIPRMTTAQKNALTATAGMTVYDTTIGRFECYTSAWGACAGGKLIGEIFMFGAGSCPAGSFATDGTSKSRTTYSALFAVIGTTYGSVDGSSFNLPNTQGIFVRGSGSQTIGSETYSATFAAKQNDATSKNGLTASSSDSGHNHSVYYGVVGGGPDKLQGGATGAFGGPLNAGSIGTGYANISTTIGAGDAETRPANIALTYCIQYL